MTHNELCDIAVRWLKRPLSGNGAGCGVAFKEVGDTMAQEIADAFGVSWAWGEGRSVLVEVKVSRSDFLADRKKSFRQHPETGMGEFRYFMCPEGLIQPDDLPPRWGLLWVNKRGHVKAVRGYLVDRAAQGYNTPETPWLFHPFNFQRERNILSYMFNRVGDPDLLLQQNREHMRGKTAAVRELAVAEETIKQLRKELRMARRKVEYCEATHHEKQGEDNGGSVGILRRDHVPGIMRSPIPRRTGEPGQADQGMCSSNPPAPDQSPGAKHDDGDCEGGTTCQPNA